jgi:hypothetical protein
MFEAITKLEEVVSDEGMDSDLMAIDSCSNQGKSAHQN